MRVITLGTGAGRPTLRRSASAVGLEYLGETFLFDCGEGTQLQLMKTAFRWGKLNAAFIGHLHGDHVNGLPGLLGTMSLSDRQTPMTVFGPKGLKKFLRLFEKIQSMALRYPLKVVEISKPGVLWESENFSVEAKPLDHVIECWGYVFREKKRPGHFDNQKATAAGIPEGPGRADLVRGEKITLADGRIFLPEDFVGPSRPGRSVAYCLDTKYGKKALGLAQGVDLLLHEATFDHTFQNEAGLWGHSTAADAARVAREAGVGELILTHISQRIQDEAVLLQEAKDIFPNTKIASDLEVFEVPGRDA